MVLKYSEDGYRYRVPPYDDAELEVLRRATSGPPIAIYRRRETRDTGSQSPAGQGSEATPDLTPKHP